MMNRLIKKLTVLFLLAFLANAYTASSYAGKYVGQKSKYSVDEVDVRSVKLSKDRTGIVRDISCFGCDFNIVNITKNTRATRAGIKVDILEVIDARDVVVGVAFDAKTREVVHISW